MDVAFHIGIDDTDSPRMGCTTYIAALLVRRLEDLGCRFADYPNIVRLNPNIPWKTRGNAAVCLRLLCHERRIDSIKEATLKVAKENSDLTYDKTDPAVAFLTGDVPSELSGFSKKVIQDIVSVSEAKRLAAKFNVEFNLIRGERGLIGALAAIGETLQGDHTYEIIAYRTPENRGSKRRVDERSVIEMDSKTNPLTFNNYDYESKRVLITPHGFDPILYGIRGENPEALLQAQSMLAVDEEVERWVIFRTNHGTDSHLPRRESISEARPFRPVVVQGKVTARPRTITGRHVIFSVSDETGSIDAAAYEPTGSFRKVVKGLIEGDVVEVYGGVRKRSVAFPRTVNLEKIKILKLAEQTVMENPRCPKCGRRMESAGREQGFRCRRCKLNMREAKKVHRVLGRTVEETLYIPPARAHRHLTKPLSRYGREKTNAPRSMIEKWHSA
jgi:tRNA(Ile2)-agmatinylcytidine synthase